MGGDCEGLGLEIYDLVDGFCGFDFGVVDVEY